MSDLEGITILAAICAGSAFGWTRANDGLRARRWPLWLRAAGGLLVLIVGGFGGFLTAATLIGTLDTPVRWTMGTTGAVMLACAFFAGRGPQTPARQKPRSHTAARADVLPHLAGFAVGVRAKWRSAVAEAEKKRAAAKAPPKPAPTLPATFAFNYRDADGVFTERVVKIRTVEEIGNFYYLTGYCDLRKEDRTFRSDRISGVLRMIYTPHTYTVQQIVRHNATVPDREN